MDGENDQAKIMWDIQIQTNKMVMAYWPSIVVVEKERQIHVFEKREKLLVYSLSIFFFVSYLLGLLVPFFFTDKNTAFGMVGISSVSSDSSVFFIILSAEQYAFSGL